MKLGKTSAAIFVTLAIISLIGELYVEIKHPENENRMALIVQSVIMLLLNLYFAYLCFGGKGKCLPLATMFIIIGGLTLVLTPFMKKIMDKFCPAIEDENLESPVCKHETEVTVFSVVMALLYICSGYALIKNV